MGKLSSHPDEFWRLGVFLDNKKLDGFIERFAQKSLTVMIVVKTVSIVIYG